MFGIRHPRDAGSGRRDLVLLRDMVCCLRCGFVCKIGARLSSSSRTAYGRFHFDLGPGRMESNHRVAVLETAALASELRREKSDSMPGRSGLRRHATGEQAPSLSILSYGPASEATAGSNRGWPRDPFGDGPPLPCCWPQVTLHHFIRRGTTRVDCRHSLSPRRRYSSRVRIRRGRPSTRNS